MPEGPQVLRRTEWLRNLILGKKVLKCSSTRKNLNVSCLEGLTITDVSCKGKQIYIEFDSKVYLFNHQLMRGRWRKVSGQQLFQPDNCWISLYFGSFTLNNINGQVLQIMNQDTIKAKMNSLGPDTMDKPYPENEILQSLKQSDLPISEALMDQSIVSGIGNVAKSEILYRAGVHPVIKSSDLSSLQYKNILEEIPAVLWETYQQGGRWTKQVYRKRNEKCSKCETLIQSIKLLPTLRNTYFCPQCQKVQL